MTGDKTTATKVTIIINQRPYHFEVDELTVVLDDMVPFSDRIDFTRYRDKRNEFYAEFTRLYAPILADNLVESGRQFGDYRS